MSKRVGFRPGFVRYSGCAKDQIKLVVTSSKEEERRRHFASVL